MIRCRRRRNLADHAWDDVVCATVSILLVSVWLSPGSSVAAAPQSASYQLATDGIVSGGETCHDGHARVAASVIGEPIANDVATPAFALTEGHFVTQRQVLLLLPHHAPTLDPVATPTAVATHTLTGTKAPDTSLWLNGAPILPSTAATAWSYTLSLMHGTTVLQLFTKDLNGHASATLTAAILLDLTPPTMPVVTDDGVSTPTFTQLHAAWTAGDPETGVAAYEYRIGTTPTGSELVPATGVGGATELTRAGLALIQGQRYYLAVRAQNGVGLWSDWGASDGLYANSTTPILNTFSPPTGSKRYVGDPLLFSASASDADGDAVEYQFKAKGSIKQPWSSLNTYTWSPTVSDRGLTVIEAEVRDGHGGLATRQHRIYLPRKPVSPP